MKLIGIACVAAGLLFADAKEQGRELTRQFREGQLAPLFDRMAPDLKRLVGTAAQLEAIRQQVLGFGSETTVLSEDVSNKGNAVSYRRVVTFEKGLTAEYIWVWDGETIQAFAVRPVRKEAPARFQDYRTKAAMRLPFDGEWLVVWGGRTIEENQHAVSPQQRFAYDILVEKDGKTSAGGRANENYFCWNQPIYAPAEGKVVTAKDGVEDNVPGKMNPAEAAGNYVVLEIAPHEYALLAHFRNGSVTVKQGDTVKQGALVGRCGNSGNSSEPHLHFHLQTAPEFGQGEGLPAEFVAFLADGKPIERGELRRNQKVRNAPER